MLALEKVLTARLEALGFAISLAAEENRIVAITGPSGVGKTSLVRGLLGLDLIRGGKAHIAQRRLDFDGRAARLDSLNWMKKNVRGCMQSVGLWPHLTVGQNLQMTWGHEDRLRSANFLSLLEQLGISGVLRKMPAELSGGERKRVGLMRMLPCTASLYCLDEVDSGLDNARKANVAQIINDFSVKTLAVVITHDSDFAGLLSGKVMTWSEIARKV